MRVSPTEAKRSSERTRAKPATGGSGTGFAENLRRATTQPAGPSVAVSELFAVGSVLSAQEVADASAEAARSRARRYGDDILDQLDQLRLAILGGSVPKDRLAALARMLRARKERLDDPHLRAAIEEIELRAEVEIAKLTRSF